jgi:hypothetical protein
MKKNSFNWKDVSCPYCGGDINSNDLAAVDVKKKTATYVCECWSGDLNHQSNRHLFLVKFTHLKQVTIDTTKKVKVSDDEKR